MKACVLSNGEIIATVQLNVEKINGLTDNEFIRRVVETVITIQYEEGSKDEFINNGQMMAVVLEKELNANSRVPVIQQHESLQQRP